MQPVAMAGPIFQTLAPSGPFHGNDGADDADRLLQRVGENLAGQRILDGLAMQRGGLPGVIPEHAEHAQLVAAGAADRRAHVQRIEL